MLKKINALPDRFCFLLLLFFASIVLFAGLSFREIESGDETRVAGISAEMIASGDFITPKLNGTPFLEYPPAYYWCESAAFAIFGKTDAAAKLPSAAAALVCAILLYLLMRDFRYSPAACAMSSIFLLSSAQFFGNSRKCMVDMLLAMFILLAWYGFQGIAKRRTKAGKTAFFLLTAAGFAGGFMTKGMVVYAISLSGLGTWLVLSDILDRKFRFGRYLLLAGAVLLSFPPSIFWGWLLYRDAGTEALHTVAIVNNLGRLLGSQGDHLEKWYYYLLKLPTLFQPWLILPVAAFFFLKKAFRENREEFPLFFLCCLCAPFLLLCASASKRQVYLLPLYAPAAMLSVWVLWKEILPWIEEKKFSETLLWTLRIVPVVLWAVFQGVLIAFEPRVPASVFPAAALASVCIGAWAPERMLDWKLRIFYIFCGLACGLTAVDTTVFASQNKENSLRTMFEDCAIYDANGISPILINPPERTSGAAYFYLGRPLPQRSLSKDELKNGPSEREIWILPSPSEDSAGIPYADRHQMIPGKK